MMFVWKHVCGEFGNTTDPLSQHLQHFLVHNIPRVHTLISFEVTLMLIIHDVWWHIIRITNSRIPNIQLAMTENTIRQIQSHLFQSLSFWFIDCHCASHTTGILSTHETKWGCIIWWSQGNSRDQHFFIFKRTTLRNGFDDVSAQMGEHHSRSIAKTSWQVDASHQHDRCTCFENQFTGRQCVADCIRLFGPKWIGCGCFDSFFPLFCFDAQCFCLCVCVIEWMLCDEFFCFFLILLWLIHVFIRESATFLTVWRCWVN